MTTVDSFLIDLDNTKTYTTNSMIPKRDRRILGSLARQLRSGTFLTKNQADLIIKILTENKDQLDLSSINIESPLWTKEFRVIDQIKRMFIDNNYIVVDFTFSKRIKELITGLNKTIDGQLLSNSPKQYLIPLTERNVYLTINALKKERFEVSETLLSFYKEISEILKSGSNPYEFVSISNDKLMSKLAEEANIADVMHLVDRRHRYQYLLDADTGNSLVGKLAGRPSTKVYINSSIVSLSEVCTALEQLNRFPVLFIFNQYEGKELVQEIDELKTIAENKSVGVYFRLDNSSSTGIEFNTKVKEYGFNARLDATTNVAGLTNNHFPKFIFKSGWYPRTVISFTNNFKNNKTSAFCDAVDLIIYYNKAAPAGGNVHEIL
jgi:hypothetical protein